MQSPGHRQIQQRRVADRLTSTSALHVQQAQHPPVTDRPPIPTPQSRIPAYDRAYEAALESSMSSNGTAQRPSYHVGRVKRRREFRDGHADPHYPAESQLFSQPGYAGGSGRSGISSTASASKGKTPQMHGVVRTGSSLVGGNVSLSNVTETFEDDFGVDEGWTRGGMGSRSGWLDRSFDEAQRIEKAATVLGNREVLVWWGINEDETVPQMRLKFEKLMCGIDPNTDDDDDAWTDVIDEEEENGGRSCWGFDELAEEKRKRKMAAAAAAANSVKVNIVSGEWPESAGEGDEGKEKDNGREKRKKRKGGS